MEKETENNEKNEEKSDFLKESARRYEEVVKQIGDDADQTFEKLKENQIDPMADEVLLQKIIANTAVIFSSEAMKKIIKHMEEKLDKDLIGDIINLIVFASCSATHQAIYFYNELLHQNLEVKFLEHQKIIEEINMHSEVHEAAMKIFNERLNEVRKKIQVDEIQK